ncbi:MAG: hypothetical protein JSS99_13010 [Actinobacteria bacterium]|nr:hypothetical protein [Actinomycetota bacterium]
MSGTAYKTLGFLVWRGGMWYLRRRSGLVKRLGAGALAASAVAAAGAAVAARRRSQA